MPLAKTFRDNLRSAMQIAGLNQQELAEKSGIHYVTISRILSGTIEPTAMITSPLRPSRRT